VSSLYRHLLRYFLVAALVPLVLLGAAAAALGRLTLATGARAFRGKLSKERRERLERLHASVVRHRTRAAAGLVLFVVSPIPSAQLFVAAGLVGISLLPATTAFFAGRVVSYFGYVGGATLVERSYGDIATHVLRSPVGIAVQVVLTGAVAALPFLPWPRPPSDDAMHDGADSGEHDAEHER